LTDIEKLLCSIVRANAVRAIYDSYVLADIVSKYWFSVCYSAANDGSSALDIYRSAPKILRRKDGIRHVISLYCKTFKYMVKKELS
jgi:hypothetical protein